MSSKILVLVVEPGKAPYTKEIDSSLESLQHEVGGYIQAVYPYDDPVALICDEEGKLKGAPLNRVLRYDDGEIFDIICGTFIITGLTEDDFGSLTPQLVEKFEGLFHNSELFYRAGGNAWTVE